MSRQIVKERANMAMVTNIWQQINRADSWLFHDNNTSGITIGDVQYDDAHRLFDIGKGQTLTYLQILHGTPITIPVSIHHFYFIPFHMWYMVYGG